MNTEPRPPRRKWPWVTAAIVLALIAAGVWFGRESTSGTPASTIPPTHTPTNNAQPTGCLGGSNRDADMLLTAQAQAPHTSNGAVELTAAFVRWLARFPVPASEEVTLVQAALMAPETGHDIAETLAESPNFSSGLVPDGTPFNVSTVLGVWYVEEYAHESARISVGVGVVINGELHPSFQLSSMYTLAWRDGRWLIVEATPPRPTKELFSLGTQFTDGC